MAQQVLKPVNFTVSLLSLALLSACGGSGGNATFTDGAETASFLGPANKELDVNKQPDQTVGIFLANGGTLSTLGQQNSPSVAIIDVDHSKTVKATPADVVAYDQVAFVSAACLFGQCPTVEAFKKAVGKSNEAAKKALEKQLAEETAKEAEQQDKEKIARLREAISAEQGEFPPDDVYAVVDVAARMNYLGTFINVDDAPFGEKISIDDVGTRKIDYERIDGKLVKTGGTIDRRFNGIGVMQDAVTGTGNRTAYFRDAAAPGWSYQTFARYYSTPEKRILETRRDLLEGYQSIGHPTTEMPASGWADYDGIAHAVYNGNQVTMLNKIHADFAKRSLEYGTTEPAVLHTFDKKGNHIIEKRPDLNLSGSASWAKDRHTFTGTVKAANGLQGRLEGRFYGPVAEEVGGVYGMKGEVKGKTVHYIGGFGAKR